MEVLAAAEEDPVINLLVLAADWRDEFPKVPLWERVPTDILFRYDLELLDRALERWTPELREFPVSRLLEWCESLDKKERYLSRELLCILPRHCDDAQRVRPRGAGA